MPMTDYGADFHVAQKRLGSGRRSAAFSAALREYVARHSPDEVTEAINRVCDQVDDQHDEFAAIASRRVLEKTEW